MRQGPHEGGSGKRWLKAELHSHCSLDPTDYKLCEHSAEELIEEASRLGYQVLAITCHNLDVWTAPLADYAADLGILLIPGMEVSTEGGRHTLVYNFRTEAGNLNTLDKIRDRSRHDTLVIAPHPYFPARSCLNSMLERRVDTFDAVERSGFYGGGIDFNRKALRIADRHRLPVVGNGDVHYLWQLGRTFTWIHAEPEIGSVVEAVKRGAVRVESTSLSYADLARWWATSLWRHVFPVRRTPSQRRPDLAPLRPSWQPVED